MKKILSLLVLVLAFSFNANAQQTKSAAELGKEDATLVVNLLKIDGTLITDLQSLFTMKHETLLIEGISEERKQVLSEVIAQKLAATFDADQISKLKQNKELYKKLISN
jgi:hypothetical protein